MSVRPHIVGRLAPGLAWLCAVLAAPQALAQPAMISPAAGEALAPGAVVEVRWPSLCDPALRSSSDREIDEAEVVLSLDGGRTFPIRVTQALRPCTTRFLWTVPALPSLRARLAVRSGREGFERTESLEFLSAEFRILRDPDGRVEQLRRRVNEWWIPPAPAALTAEDLLERSMSPANGQISAPVASIEATDPARPLPNLRPSRAAGFLLAQGRQYALPDSALRTRPAGAPAPLRL